MSYDWAVPMTAAELEQEHRDHEFNAAFDDNAERFAGEVITEDPNEEAYNWIYQQETLAAGLGQATHVLQHVIAHGTLDTLPLPNGGNAGEFAADALSAVVTAMEKIEFDAKWELRKLEADEPPVDELPF